MLHITDLTYSYPDTDTPALRSINLSLEQGEMLLVTGGTGSGKSTLCYALAGFAPHFFRGEMAGDVTLRGRSMRESTLGEWVQHVGLVLQNPFNQITGARMTVFGEVAFGLENLGVPREQMAARVAAVLEQLDISHLAERSPYALSGGQMQRVALASILVLEPALLVLDEPTAQLDPEGTGEVFAALRRLADKGAAVVLATHQLTEAAPLATRALVLQGGELVLEGPTRALLSDPRLPGWRVEPPIYTTLAARAGARPPASLAHLPTTLDEALLTFSGAPGPAQPADPPPLALPDVPPFEPTPVEAESIHFHYPSGVHALRGVSLQLEPGRVTALIGANGAGKSTLSRSLNGLLRPQAGTVRVGDWSIAQHPTSQLARRVGYLFQNPDDQLFKATVEEEIAFGPLNLQFTEEARQEAVELAIALTGLDSVRHSHPYDLHAVQRRWVAIASVLALRAPVLILDEPTMGQDLVGKVRLAALLSALREAGSTLLLVSHDMQFVAEMADAVIVMAEGQVLAQGGPGEVFAQEASLARAAVAAPPVARLARALALPAEVVRTESFVAAWRQRHEGS